MFIFPAENHQQKSILFYMDREHARIKMLNYPTVVPILFFLFFFIFLFALAKE